MGLSVGGSRSADPDPDRPIRPGHSRMRAFDGTEAWSLDRAGTRVSEMLRNQSFGNRGSSVWEGLPNPLIADIDPARVGPRGGVVTQRSAKPFTPVQFWSWPP